MLMIGYDTMVFGGVHNVMDREGWSDVTLW